MQLKSRGWVQICSVPRLVLADSFNGHRYAVDYGSSGNNIPEDDVQEYVGSGIIWLVTVPFRT